MTEDHGDMGMGMGAISRMQVVVRGERISHLDLCTLERQSLCESHRQRRWLTCWSESVTETLVMPLGGIVAHLLVDRRRESPFTAHDTLPEGLLFDRAHEPFRIGIEMRTVWRQGERLHVTVLAQAIKGLRAFGIPLVDQRPFPQAEPVAGVRQRSSALLPEGRVLPTTVLDIQPE